MMKWVEQLICNQAVLSLSPIKGFR